MVMEKMKLVYDSAPGPGAKVEVGDEVISFRNERYTVTGWREPQHAGSTGRVYVKPCEDKYFSCREFFPSVFASRQPW
jgi:hypothetical protein